jgi:hypothetical protein
MIDQESFLRNILDAFPSFVFVVDSNSRIVLSNRAASRMLGTPPEVTLRRLCGDVLGCINAKSPLEVCGTTQFCPECVVRKAVRAALEGKVVFREKYKMHLQEPQGKREVYFLVNASPFEHDGEALALLVLEDISELMEMGGLIPICSNCRKVREDQEYWEELEDYLAKHTELKFTHGICPECTKKLYPGYSGQKGKPDGKNNK